MARTLHRLTALKVERAKKPGLYGDGGSLYLRIAPGGSKQWVFRYGVSGRYHDLSLGAVHTFSLADARERAREQRKLLADGLDPLAAKRERAALRAAADATAMSFAQCAAAFIRDNRSEWRSIKHAREWESTLRRFAYPVIGGLLVQVIDTPLVLRVIEPLWKSHPVTAQRVRGRIEAVLGWATVHRYRNGDNPARWRGHLEHALPKRNGVKHLAALPYTDIPGFVAKLRQDTSVASAALQLVTLTAVRRGEAIFAEWSEVDLDDAVWTIPAGRTKRNREHRVPLSNLAVALLRDMATIRQSAYVFPGYLAGRPISDNSVTRVMQATASGTTIHGLRSSFRDWAAERTSFAREVAEAALAHAVASQVEAAYRRTDFFDRRRKLMAEWAAFCQVKPSTGSGVVPIRAARP